MNLHDALALGDRGVVSIVGGGGKTTLMYALAQELVSAGRSVLTTTTTRIFMPAGDQASFTIISPEAEEIVKEARVLLDHSSHLTAGSEYLREQGKLNGLKVSVIEYILKADLFDFIIIEADGAARRPLKACGLREPVIPPFSHHIIALAGLDAVAKPLSEEWVFRSSVFSRITGLRPMEKITESSIARVMTHDMFSASVNCNASMKIAFLNKADTAREQQAGERIAAYLENDGTVFHRTIIGSLMPEPVIHQCRVIQ